MRLTNWQLTTNGAGSDSVPYDPFTMSTLNSAMPPTQYNPYLEDTNNMAGNPSAYYQGQPTFAAPPQPVSFSILTGSLC
jgi:PAB-dependent poly(A)-specific ribonuclease subunit 3